jgi:tRNA (guanine37-N1)-methyltransferase
VRVAAVTLFPELMQDALRWGVVGQALERGLWSLTCSNPRQFARPPRQNVDDRPYGGGPGMVMMYEPLAAAIQSARAAVSGATPLPDSRAHTIFLSPHGKPLQQADVRRLAVLPAMVLVCGRYEGVDERLIEDEIDESISIGDFVLSGGEFAALALCDAVVRLLPGVLGDQQSAIQESFSFGRLDHPHYTRPERLPNGKTVPEALLSGNHAAIAAWREAQALARTEKYRPDLLVDPKTTPPDR